MRDGHRLPDVVHGNIEMRHCTQPHVVAHGEEHATRPQLRKNLVGTSPRSLHRHDDDVCLYTLHVDVNAGDDERAIAAMITLGASSIASADLI